MSESDLSLCRVRSEARRPLQRIRARDPRWRRTDMVWVNGQVYGTPLEKDSEIIEEASLTGLVLTS